MIRRPLEGEAPSGFFTYINQVIGNDPLAVMDTQLSESIALLSGITEQASLHRYAAGKWSIRELLNHVTDTERAFAFRVLWFSRGFETPLPGYDQDVAATGAKADKVSWAAHIEEFRLVRLATLALFRNMPQDGWKRSGTASGNFVTVPAMAYVIPGHVEHHLCILRERYL